MAKALAPSLGLFQKGVKKVVTSGAFTNFWNDVWASNSSLRSLIEGPFNKDEEGMLVKNCLSPSGGWYLDHLSFVFPDTITDLILSVPLSLKDNLEKIIWLTLSAGSIPVMLIFLLKVLMI